MNYMSKVFRPYFLQRLQAQGEPLDKNALGQLTQLHLSTSLECTYYWGPRLPFFLHVKKFSSANQAFETPMESLLYKQMWKSAWMRRDMFCLCLRGITLTEGWHCVWMVRTVSVATHSTCWGRKPLKGDTFAAWAMRWCRSLTLNWRS
ncbi:FAST kinase domain-containing protein 3, mitochondrial-like [Perca flavescens]|uniref:FAST kinase domain-containing protein 3, mitochondrial-like n=1 Tax=Perca flavescens TaxID=8167 RepID=UPI00106EB995|nr:FAST kinase domain-containing protein 3, mitochondrial-like [Perca flavescens]